MKTESLIKGTNLKAVVSFLFSSFNRSPTEIVKSISLYFIKSFDNLFQATNFSGVNSVESFIPRITKLPSSPNSSKNLLYSTLI